MPKRPKHFARDLLHLQLDVPLCHLLLKQSLQIYRTSNGDGCAVNGDVLYQSRIPVVQVLKGHDLSMRIAQATTVVDVNIFVFLHQLALQISRPTQRYREIKNQMLVLVLLSVRPRAPPCAAVYTPFPVLIAVSIMPSRPPIAQKKYS